MAKRVLIIGGGGREHAIAWKLSQSQQVETIFAAPGSAGIQQVPKAKNILLNIKDFKVIGQFCRENVVSLVVVGPEDPLAGGIADVLAQEGVPVFGPKRAAARIEADKGWAKAFMDSHGIPTARWKAFRSADEAKQFIKTADFPALVVKASGLAAGKGVVVAESCEAACKAVDEMLGNRKFGAAGETVVVEELLQGEEVSVLAFCDGSTVRAMLPAQDHKRIFDNDQGPNTGGMGAYCPCPLLSRSQLEGVEQNVLQRTVEGFRKEGIHYNGVLYAGLMMTEDGPKVLEFNCRFGDPETEAILPLLESDLYAIMEACCNGTLHNATIEWRAGLSAVGVVLASKGYPEGSSKGQKIVGVEDVNRRPNHVVFYCGAELIGGELVTSGGRVLIAVALAPTLTQAAAQACRAAEAISFDGKQFRRDIAHKGIAKAILQMGQMTYKKSGVDISAGNGLVAHIKPAAETTNRAGVVGNLGGFGGLFDLKAAGFEDPLLVSGTDGVGTKLKIAQQMGIHTTIGIDLVAMCVNDVLAHGAEPLFFLDYFACGALDTEVAKDVVSSIADGCRLANCSLIGGETAEMSDMYAKGEYDLAGFAVGAVEKQQLMPRMGDIQAGDVVIGLPSSGVHSNGFSLVRKVMDMFGVHCRDAAPFSKDGKSFGEELLTPTEIYVKTVMPAVKTGKVKAFAHITGGGLLENVPRVLPQMLSVELDAEKWKIPSVFPWLAAAGGISEFEMLRTFNCGIGGVLIVGRSDVNEILNLTMSQSAVIIGNVVKNTNNEQVVVHNFTKVMEMNMRPYVKHIIEKHTTKKRVGVLISGSGTNLQSLINATQDPSKQMGCEIVLVVSNKNDVEGLRRAERANIPTKVIVHRDYPNRVEFDRIVTKALQDAGVEIVCLAGFMRILSGEFVRTWRTKLINIHPSLLPSFKGTHAQRQALEAGVRISGCTVHFVEEEIDSGLIITQESVQIELDDTEETLIERIKTYAEQKAYPRALQLVATGKVKLADDDNKLIWSF